MNFFSTGNRRLDEWVPQERVDRTRVVPETESKPILDVIEGESDRKITRNQKRKHDEINHVQKVKKL